tara:strand:+ start:7795 stop:8097 length:303 start_codon:yes stop_codon:yes gene_type:complete
MAEKIKIKTIPFEEIIDIQISGAFYVRIQNIFLSLIQNLKDDDLKKLLEKIQTKPEEITDPVEYNIVTLMILMNEIEHQAKSTNKVKDQEIDIPENGTDL